MRVQLDIQVQIVAKLSDAEYGEMDLVLEIDSITVNIMKIQMKMDLGELWNDAVDEVKSNIEENQDRNSTMEYKHFILN